MRNLIFILMTGAAFWVASCSSSSKHAASKPAASTKGKHTLKVMSYNVHHCNPPSKEGYIDIDAIAKVIERQEPDIVALQEIDVHTQRSGANNQAEEIAYRLDMNYYFGKAIDYEGGEYGVAILSKYPLSETVVNRLPTKTETNGEPRILATAKITLPDGSAIRFGSTHLDAQKEPGNRKLQMEEIVKITSSEKLPFVIAGDFNSTPESNEIQLLDKYFTRTCQTCAPTIPVVNPSKTIDFIAFTPTAEFSVTSNEVIMEPYASDHLPVVAVLKY
ncbi:endonuclease/exonuclease/phosphatase family protein [Pontibacter silvestris]|uniref:Endonuclease/exonuclease/phosphatase family protein n=1 Tax=Pontibacter silvestris TaxID=2305183 RepID=A0ABW4WVL7_9BACT|nr:endonuclease/exonuclease/phosphatase family protein [Pontibacter silvestris]MCC9138593.1 endonuclease/exonuclease/phosphatase family protein [Pontibacter silvestris]